MVEHGLWEGLTRRRRAKVAVEAEGLGDRQVRLDGEHRRSGPLLFTEDLSTALVEHTVYTADGVLGALNLDYIQGQCWEFRFGEATRVHTEIDGLLKSRLREQAGSVADTTTRRNDLSSTTVNGVGVQLVTTIRQ